MHLPEQRMRPQHSRFSEGLAARLSPVEEQLSVLLVRLAHLHVAVTHVVDAAALAEGAAHRDRVLVQLPGIGRGGGGNEGGPSGAGSPLPDELLGSLAHDVAGVEVAL